MNLRTLKEEDWSAVSSIYQEGIDTGNATFESKSPKWNEWNQSHIKSCRIVAEVKNQIVGWAALSPVSSRCVYGGVAEVSVYVSTSFSGQGIGTRLLNRLIEESEEAGIWTLQAGLFPENKASLTIHKKVGFREIGFRERIGKMNGVWRDTVLLERRSSKTGL